MKAVAMEHRCCLFSQQDGAVSHLYLHGHRDFLLRADQRSLLHCHVSGGAAGLASRCCGKPCEQVTEVEAQFSGARPTLFSRSSTELSEEVGNITAVNSCPATGKLANLKSQQRHPDSLNRILSGTNEMK